MNEQVAQFVGVTGASPEVARALLEQTGDITTAIDAYYAGDAPAGNSEPKSEADGSQMIGGAAAGPWPGASSSSASSSGASTRKSAPRRGGVMSFSDLRGSQSTRDDDDPVHMFAGGERSGLNIENPDSQGPNSLVDDILRQAAQGTPPAEEHVPEKKAFTGKGHSLTDPDPEPEAEAPRSNSLLEQFANFLHGNPAAAKPELERVQRHLTFWQDGFSLGDGPLMHYDNPEHAEILRAIQSGHAPLDLLDVRPGQEVEMVVARRMNERYQPPPPPPARPFSGEGNRLGSAAPTVEDTHKKPAPARVSDSAAQPAPPPVDPAQPTTRVQVRLPDGGRVVIQLNQHNTVGVLRAHINSARPELAQRAYTLQGGFPPHPLTDDTQNVADAGLLNSVVLLQLI
ncbi:protein phosphatase regulator [Malassezia cuniculi]|uniref:Protein phosphatase regulator n=1 Tax=Malassezia cuniculi TaxID=948313 RepID=A0AAF0EUM9_9BASI|nr:protein phosphatase regulator [Malassezia cuniculi]